MPSVKSVIEDWKTKLIDLTRRNRLLFFRVGRVSALQIVEPSLDEVFDRLVVKEKSWNFYSPPIEATDERDTDDEQLDFALSDNKVETVPCQKLV